MRRRTECLLFRWLSPHHFLILMGVTAFLAFVCGYAISVGSGKISAVFPYISDTGTTFPASGVFGLLLNLSAVFAVIAIYIRHSYNEASITVRRHYVVNDIGMFCGVLICLGLMMVACFPWTKVLVPHLIGAFLVFVLGCIYCWIQCFITFITSETWRSVVFLFRVVLSFVSTMSFILTIAYASFAMKKSKGKIRDSLKWKSDEPGYSDHLGSTFSEWIMAISFLLYFSTYYPEFRCLESTVKVATKSYEELEVEQ